MCKNASGLNQKEVKEVEDLTKQNNKTLPPVNHTLVTSPIQKIAFSIYTQHFYWITFTPLSYL